MNILSYSPFVPAINYLSLLFALWALFMRGRAMKAINSAFLNKENAQALMRYNNMWTLAAFLWAISGIILFGRRLDPGTEWLTEDLWIRLNVALLICIFIFELKLMSTIIRWRLGLLKNKDLKIPLNKHELHSLIKFNSVVIVLMALVPLVTFAPNLIK